MNAQLAPEMIGTDERSVRVCFVCTGNTCRSPMAAAVLNALGGGRFIATSAGLAAAPGREMSENARRALENAGIDAPPHCSRQVDAGIIAESDIVIGISSSHFMVLLQSFPAHAAKLEAMTQDVGDPYGCDLATYERCLAQITACIKERFAL